MFGQLYCSNHYLLWKIEVNILHISASYKPAFVYGGPIMSVAILCEALHNQGENVQVFSTTANGHSELDITAGASHFIDGVDVIYFKRITGDHTHLSLTLLRALWKNIKNFDVVHVNAWWNWVSVLGCWVALMRNKPVVVTPRGMLSPYSFHNHNRLVKRMLFLWLGKPLLKHCHLHATSKKEAEDMQQLVQSKSSHTLHNLVMIPEGLPKKEKSSISVRCIRLLFFSRIDPVKGLDTLFEALAETNIQYSLTVAGGGESAYIEHLQGLATNLNIDCNLQWLGQINPEAKWDLLASHDLLILPSHNESFANVVVESLVIGTPVLVSNKVGLGDYVQHIQAGWVSELNSKDIANHIEQIYYLGQQYWQLGKEVSTQVRRDFSAAALIPQYMDMYRQVIANS